MRQIGIFIALCLFMLGNEGCGKEDPVPFENYFRVTVNGEMFELDPVDIWYHDLFLGNREYLTRMVATRPSDSYEFEIDFPNQNGALAEGKSFTQDTTSSANEIGIYIRRPDGNGFFELLSTRDSGGVANLFIDRYDFERGLTGTFNFSITDWDTVPLVGTAGSFSMAF